MQTCRTLLLLLAISFGSTGCLARQVASDGCHFRQALLDMYTDQVMENLIHASENQPFVQLAYRNLIVTDTQILKGNLGGEVDPSSSRTSLRLTSALLTSMRSVSSKLGFGANLERDRTMQFRA